MSNFKTIDEARVYFSGDRFATENGIRASCVVNVDVVDDTGREIAQFVGTGFKLK